MPRQSPRPYTNAVLTVIALLLAMHLVVRVSDAQSGASAAFAQPARDSVDQPGDIPFNATAQRKTMIAQLEQMSRRLGAIEARLDKGVNVRVLEMPEIKFPRD